MTSTDPLGQLAAEMATDKSLPLIDANLVFGEGDPKAAVLFIGEAPGSNEDKLGRPFVGRAGKLLDSLIEEIGWQRSQVYITNIIKRRPPANRDPLPEEIEAYKPYLERQLQIIDPKVIVPLGRFAMAYFLPEGKISRDQGRVFWWHDMLIMPVYHPAAALRRPDLVNDLRAAFAKLPRMLAQYDALLKERGKGGLDKESGTQKGLFT